MARKASSIRMVSKDRYTATAAQRRKYGGRTVTEFYATAPDGRTIVVTGYGKTPGERKTFARKVAEEKLAAPASRNSKRYRTFTRGRWSFDWDPKDGELRAYIKRPRKGEPAGDYAAGKYPTLEKARRVGAPKWARKATQRFGMAAAMRRNLDDVSFTNRTTAHGVQITEVTLSPNDKHTREVLVRGSRATKARTPRQQKVKKSIEKVYGNRFPAERNFFDFSVPDSKLGE